MIERFDCERLDRALLQRLLAGEILLLPARTASLAVAERAWQCLCDTLGTTYPASLHEIWSPGRLHQALAPLRRSLGDDAALRTAYADLLTVLGLELKRWRVDQPRLRAVIPGAERVPAAAPMFYPHRDTWYANPPGQINLWLPLADYPAAQTFVFWPDRFAAPVANDSERFDYASWKRQTGFQNPAAPADSAYPRALRLPAETPAGFACRRGELLLFAGAQLHATLPNPGPEVRFSLDLRLVCPDAGAAPNADNRSRGTTLADYVYLGAGA